eukprot:Skav222864  [mRNA]  locus=scaffold2201:284118:285600:- [translate_table: standard]
MYRITHSRDPVPHLPPRFLTGFKYEHVNYEVFYDDENLWHFCAQEEDRSCADQYSLPTTLRYASDHCASPLTSSGSLCHCPLDGAWDDDDAAPLVLGATVSYQTIQGLWP